MRNECYIYDHILNDKKLNNVEIIILLALNSLMLGSYKDNCISLSALCYAIYGRTVKPNIKDKIRINLESVIRKGYIELVSCYDKSSYILNLSNIYVDTKKCKKENSSFYVCISKDELHKIMNVPQQIEKFKLAVLFIHYINSLYKGDKIESIYRAKIGFMPLEIFTKKASISYQTLLNYNQILESEKLLFIIRHKYRGGNSYIDGFISNETNTYSRYKDRRLCQDFVDSKKKNSYNSSSYSEKNEKQSMSKKIYHFENGTNKEYTFEELISMKKYIDDFNQQIYLGEKIGTPIDDSKVKIALAVKTQLKNNI